MQAWRGVRATDALLALTLLAIAAASVSAADDYAGGRTRLAVALVFQTLPLVWWRAAPLRAVVLSAFGVAVEVAGVAAYGEAAGFLGFLVLLYAVPRHAEAGQRRLGAAVLAGGFVVHLVAQPHEGPLGLLGPVVTTGALSVAAWSLGSAMRRRAEDVVALEARGRREAEWAAAAQERVVEEERRRISRELHDVVGHALSAISLSAGAAEQQPGLPEPVRRSLRHIRESSRGAATDLRQLVGLLRTADDLERSTPQPTLSAVPGLAQQWVQAGMHVDVTVDGDAAGVPLGVQLAAFRVVQEGLTNVAKHAPQASAQVTVRIATDHVEVAVEDDGQRRDVPVQRGHGLIGLGERVQLYRGTLTTTSAPGGGLRLSAVLPFGSP